jgi:hypothetical protein
VEAQPTWHDETVQQEADSTFDFGFDMDSNVDNGFDMDNNVDNDNGDNSETSSAAQFTEGKKYTEEDTMYEWILIRVLFLEMQEWKECYQQSLFKSLTMALTAIWK